MKSVAVTTDVSVSQIQYRQKVRSDRMKEAFFTLRHCLPINPPDCRLSQLNILKLAIDYITALADMIVDSDNHRKETDGHVEGHGNESNETDHPVNDSHHHMKERDHHVKETDLIKETDLVIQESEDIVTESDEAVNEIEDLVMGSGDLVKGRW